MSDTRKEQDKNYRVATYRPSGVSLKKVADLLNAGKAKTFDFCCSECQMALQWLSANGHVSRVGDSNFLKMNPEKPFNIQ